MILMVMGDDQRIKLLYIMRLKIGKHITGSFFVTGINHDVHRVVCRTGLNQNTVTFSNIDRSNLKNFLSSGNPFHKQQNAAHKD